MADFIFISKAQTDDNRFFLGHDEDHNGDWDNFYMCPNCREYNYITLNESSCAVCLIQLFWI